VTVCHHAVRDIDWFPVSTDDDRHASEKMEADAGSFCHMKYFACYLRFVFFHTGRDAFRHPLTLTGSPPLFSYHPRSCRYDATPHYKMISYKKKLWRPPSKKKKKGKNTWDSSHGSTKPKACQAKQKCGGPHQVCHSELPVQGCHGVGDEHLYVYTRNIGVRASTCNRHINNKVTVRSHEA
jgi:hypothetical protein